MSLQKTEEIEDTTVDTTVDTAGLDSNKLDESKKDILPAAPAYVDAVLSTADWSIAPNRHTDDFIKVYYNSNEDINIKIIPSQPLEWGIEGAWWIIEEIDADEAELLLEEMESVLLQNEFVKDNKRQMIETVCGGSAYKHSSIWTNGQSFVFKTIIAVVENTDLPNPYGDIIAVEFGYLGTKELVESLENNQAQIMHAMINSHPLGDQLRPRYLYINDDNHINLIEVVDNENESRSLVKAVHGCAEDSTFYFSQDKETNEISILFWLGYDVDGTFVLENQAGKISSCSALEESNVTKAELDDIDSIIGSMKQNGYYRWGDVEEALNSTLPMIQDCP